MSERVWPRVLTLALLTSSLWAGCPSFWPAVAVSSGAHVADVLSSRGAIELNPILGRGPFGWKQATRKMTVVGTLVASEAWLLRKQPRLCRVLTLFNVTAAAGTGVVVGINLKRRRRP